MKILSNGLQPIFFWDQCNSRGKKRSPTRELSADEVNGEGKIKITIKLFYCHTYTVNYKKILIGFANL